MLVEEVDITFSNLLTLAVGTPEVGAVNFNFLHEFLLEILNHLGISEKLARITQEVDYRTVDPSPYNQPEKVFSKGNVSTESRSQLQLPPGSEREGEKLDSDVSTPLPEEDGKSQEERKPSIVCPDEPVTGRRKSSLIHKRKASQGYGMGPRGSLQPVDSVINSKTDSGESLTKAGDMWHVLNINRRVETAEAAIEGLTSLFDSLNRELDEIRNQAQENNGENDGKSNLKQYGGMEDQENLAKPNESHEHLKGGFSDINNRINNLATKDDIKAFCNTSQVKEMIDKNLMAFKHAQPPTTSVIEGSKVVANEDPGSVQAFHAEMQGNNQTILDQIKALENTLSILKDEANGDKLSNLQDELNQVKKQINSLEVNIHLKSNKESNQESSDIPNISLVIEPIRNNLDSVSGTVNGLNTNLDSLRGIVNGLDESIQSVKKDISGLLNRNDTFADIQKNMSNSISKLQRDIEDTMDNLQNVQTGTLGKKSSEIDADSALTKLRGTMYDLQEKQSEFQNEIDSLSQDERRKDKELKEINIRIDGLEQTKVDQDFVRKQVESKADKKDLANTLSREQFDDCINGIDRNIQNMIQDMQGAETKNNKNLTNLQEIVDDKLNREEAMQIRGYIDSRFKSFKPKIQQVKPSEDCAAGSRKRVMPDCNCISCDRPVDVPVNDPCPALPYYHALPGMKSIRPVTTFELQTIRQHMQHNWPQGNKDRYLLAEARGKLQKELLQLCGAQDLDEITVQSVNRPCGGVHTLGQHRKNPGKPPMFYREDHSQFQPAERERHETNVVGKDGHIYKGRKQLQQEADLSNIHNSSNKSRSAEALLQRDNQSNMQMESVQKTDIVTVLPTIQTA